MELLPSVWWPLGWRRDRPSRRGPVTISVDTAVKKGAFTPFWAWFGHDEPNYTYTPNGKKLLSALQAASPVPVFMRVHNLLTTGDGKHALKWGSTNAYTEDAKGNPVYDWKIVDLIVDSYMERKMKPFVQLGFMPEALSSAPAMCLIGTSGSPAIPITISTRAGRTRPRTTRSGKSSATR